MRIRRATQLFALVAVVATAVAACGSSGGSTASGGSSAGGTHATASIPAGTAADSSKSPVVVGFSSTEGKTIADTSPEVRVGFDQGIKYVNEHLGGVNGHPIKVIDCKTDNTPASGVECANNFVRGKAVTVFHGLDYQDDAELPIIEGAGIPIIAFITFGPASQAALGEVFTTQPALPEYFADALQLAKQQGKSNVVLALPDRPEQHPYAAITTKFASKLGIKADVIFYPSTGVNWQQVKYTVEAKNPDAILFPATGDSDCTGLLPAFQGTSALMYTAGCTAKALNRIGAAASGDYGYIPFYSESDVATAPADVKADIAVYSAYMDATGYADGPVTGYGGYGFQLAVDGARMMQGVTGGDITPAAIKSAIPTVSGRSFLDIRTFKCDGTAWKGQPSCVKGLLMAKFENGAMHPLPGDPLVSSLSGTG